MSMCLSWIFVDSSFDLLCRFILLALFLLLSCVLSVCVLFFRIFISVKVSCFTGTFSYHGHAVYSHTHLQCVRRIFMCAVLIIQHLSLLITSCIFS
ncbi:hypothetical protein BDR07DRAFT_1612952 [Suillus spraguei]|nr:hypothetical protein BDR07DRAFT_1612952 [Suillus spraguei]